MTTGMLGHPCPGSVAGLQMGSNVPDKAWTVQDGLVMPTSMRSLDFSGLLRPARDAKNGDMQRYPYPVAEQIAKLEVL